MRKTLDRLLRALVPYAGVLTVASGPCSDPSGDCGAPNQTRVTMTAQVAGEVALETDTDGRIAVRIANSDGVPRAEWRCQGQVVASHDRTRGDEPVTLTPTATINCQIEEGGRTTTGSWTFTVPLVDLRAETFVPETKVVMDVNDQNPTAGTGCNGKLEVRVTTAVVRAQGREAPAPAYVSSDFARELEIRIDVDGTSTASTTPACSRSVRGTVSLTVQLVPESFVESEFSPCL